MMTGDHDELVRLGSDLSFLNSGGGFGDVRSIFREKIDHALPSEDVSTHHVAVDHRVMASIGGEKVHYDENLTPYLTEVHEALDDPTKNLVVIKGPARSGKTVSAENYLLKIGMFGPSRNVLWYMHSEPDLKRYVQERVKFMLSEEAHPDLYRKVSRKVGENAWNLKRVDGALWEWLPANDSTTRARSAALIVGDEIDAMRPAIRDAFLTLIYNRQREYGAMRKAFVASHPDAGPLFGIDQMLIDTDLRVRIWTCPHCAHLCGPAYEVPKGRKITWNLPELFKRSADMPRDELLQYAAENVRLICPNKLCSQPITNEERLEVDRQGVWMAKGQEIDEFENIIGDRVQKNAAGFVTHAFMAPFVSLQELSQEWIAAMIHKKLTGQDSLLRQVHVKSMGETHRDDDPASKEREWKAFKSEHLDTSYRLGHVPLGVRFLTAFVDIQGDSYEVIVIGWNQFRESWLIDRFSIKQRLGLKNIDPAQRIEDWEVLEKAVLAQVYPLADGSGRYLRIAKMAVDTGGKPGVTNNARIWASNLLGRDVNPIEQWRILLSKGDAHTKMNGPLFGPPRAITHDDAQRELPVTVYERTVDVTEVKRIIAARMDTEQPGPLFMHLPKDIQDIYVRELVSEVYLNGEWVPTGGARNETWDGWVMCEVARMMLAPDNVAIDWVNDPPTFAVPFDASQKRDDGDKPDEEQDYFSRLAAINRG